MPLANCARFTPVTSWSTSFHHGSPDCEPGRAPVCGRRPVPLAKRPVDRQVLRRAIATTWPAVHSYRFVGAADLMVGGRRRRRLVDRRGARRPVEGGPRHCHHPGMAPLGRRGGGACGGPPHGG